MKIGIFLFITIMNLKIAIQGIKGSFHHQVAQEYYDQDVVVDEFLKHTAIGEAFNDLLFNDFFFVVGRPFNGRQYK